MNRLRTGGQARISFFSFQDIITSVTGILILVTLMLSFSLRLGEPEESEEQRLEAALQRARQRLGEVERENQLLQERRLEAVKLPDQTQIEIQLDALRREQSQLEAQRTQSEARLVSARERFEKIQAQKDTADALRRKVEETQQQLKDLQEQLARAKTNQSVVFVIPDAEEQRMAKNPVAVVVNGTSLHAQRLNGTGAQDVAVTSGESLAPILERYDPERDFFVFFFRPSGAKWFEEFRTLARNAGFEVGYDAVEEQKKVAFATQ